MALILPALCQAQWKAPVYSNEFLHLGSDAAGLGTAGTEAASTKDANSFFWNPAGLARLKAKTQVAGSLGFFDPQKGRQQVVSIAGSVDSLTTIGFSFLRYSSKNQPLTGELGRDGEVNFDNIVTFSSQHQALVFTAARKDLFRKGLSLGFNFRLLYQETGSFGNGWGFGVDAGAQYTWKEWQLGLMVRDLIPTLNSWSYNPSELQAGFGSTSNVLPERAVEVTLPSFHPGIARRFSTLGDKLGIQPAFQLPIFMDGNRNSPLQAGRFSLNPRLGLTLDFLRFFLIRTGIGEMEKNQGFRFNLGAGIRWKSVTFDYAFSKATSLSNPAGRQLIGFKLDL